VSQLLRKLVTHDVCTLAALVQLLAREPNFLSEEVQAFLVQEGRQAFRSAWRTLASASTAYVAGAANNAHTSANTAHANAANTQNTANNTSAKTASKKTASASSKRKATR
jgi:hypothetical protein